MADSKAAKEILANLKDPDALEKFYRDTPRIFATGLREALEEQPHSETLNVWRARLLKGTASQPRPAPQGADPVPEYILIAILSVLAGTLYKLPKYFKEIVEGRYYVCNMALIALGALAIFFGVKNKIPKGLAFFVAGAFALMALYLNWMVVFPLKDDSVMWALAYAPCLMFSIAALTYVGERYKTTEAWLDFIRFAVESCLYAALMAAGTMALIAFSAYVFSLILPGKWVEEVILEHGGVYGVCAAGLIAARLVASRQQADKSLVPAIARVFSPALFVLFSLLIVVMIFVGKNPFLDREFLITCNAILVAVLGLSVFSIFESVRAGAGVADKVNFGMVLLALGLDAMTLSSILFRLGSYGLTPNRLMILGINLLVAFNLLLVLRAYLKLFKDRGTILQVAEVSVKYLPVYQLWSAFVVFAAPFLFSFK